MLKKFEGYFYLNALQVLNLNMNYIEDLGNYTMMGTGLNSLEHFKLNENRLVLCDKFFDGILKMENLKVLDIKDSIMPCICSLNNITNLSNIGNRIIPVAPIVLILSG